MRQSAAALLLFVALPVAAAGKDSIWYMAKLAGSKDDTRQLLRIVNERFIPNRVLILASSASAQLALVKEMKPLGDKATAYVCEHYVCKLPTSDPGRFAALLE